MRELLSESTPLYVQLQIAKHSPDPSAATADEERSLASKKKSSKAERGLRDKIGKIMTLFRRDSDLEKFSSLAKQVRDMAASFPGKESALVCLLLFNSDKSSKDSSPKLKSELQELLSDIKFDTKTFVELLVQMAVAFSYVLVDIDDNDAELKSVSLPYTEEEEKWLQHEIELIDEAYQSVPIGEYVMNEFMMYSLGVPLSKNYFAAATSIGLERIFRMSKTQSAFSEIPAFERTRIFGERSLLAWCLTACKFDSCKTGMDQLRLGFGLLDKSYWKERFELVFSNREVKKVGFLECSYELQKLLTNEQKSIWSSVVDIVSRVTEDNVVYGLVMLIVMTFPDDSTKSLTELHSRLRILMKRRLISKAKFDPEVDFPGTQDPDETVARVLSGLLQLRNILKIVNSLTSKPPTGTSSI